MKQEWHVIFKPETAVTPINYGPFPFQSWALGWAFLEMKDYPLSWWHVKNLKTKKPKKEKIRNRYDV